jgi:rod shape determining protein RodA
MLLIILQPDAGSMLVFLSFSILLYREGLSPVPYIIGFILLLVFILAIYFGDNSGELIMYLMMLATGIFTFNVKQGRNLWLSITGVIAALALWLFFSRSQEWGLALMTAIVLFYIIVFSRRGRFKIVLLTGSALFVSIALIYSTNFMFSKLKPHQRDRIWVWLRPDKVDPRGAAYNLINSKMAIGSGGFLGKGFTEGTMTKLNFVPEQQTDFIFCTIGEEQGFVGAFAVVALYMIFLVRIVQVAERQRSNFVRLYAYGLAGIFFVHFFINIGMTMGLLPVIGIPLPFISAGGSSLLGFTAMLAILLKLDSNRYSV